MDMEKIDLKGSMIMLAVLAAIFGAYKMIQIIMLLVTGTTAEVALSGNIAVPEVINNTTSDVVDSIASGYTLFNVGDAIILGLIGLVVILKLFWPLIMSFMKGGKSGGFN